MKPEIPPDLKERLGFGFQEGPLCFRDFCFLFSVCLTGLWISSSVVNASHSLLAGGWEGGSLHTYIFVLTKVKAKLCIILGDFSSDGVLTGKQILAIVSIFFKSRAFAHNVDTKMESLMPLLTYS